MASMDGAAGICSDTVYRPSRAMEIHSVGCLRCFVAYYSVVWMLLVLCRSVGQHVVRNVWFAALSRLICRVLNCRKDIRRQVMIYNSAVLASRPVELMTANKNCKLGLQIRLTKKRFSLQ